MPASRACELSAFNGLDIFALLSLYMWYSPFEILMLVVYRGGYSIRILILFIFFLCQFLFIYKPIVLHLVSLIRPLWSPLVLNISFCVFSIWALYHDVGAIPSAVFRTVFSGSGGVNCMFQMFTLVRLDLSCSKVFSGYNVLVFSLMTLMCECGS